MPTVPSTLIEGDSLIALPKGSDAHRRHWREERWEPMKLTHNHCSGAECGTAY